MKRSSKKSKRSSASVSASARHDEGDESVAVIVRLRPEAGSEAAICLRRRDATTLELRAPHDHRAQDATASSLAGQVGTAERPATTSTPSSTSRLFRFDRVFGADASQAEVYQPVYPLVRSAIRGYNATVFAYGSTGSGKTFTMDAVVARSVDTIFSTLRNVAAQQSDALFHVQMSFVELYNNNFRNLLDSNSGGNCDQQGHRIEVHESASDGVHLTGPRLRVHVSSADEVMRLLKQGTRARAVGATNLNEHSSRSHSILTFHVESKSHDAELLPLDSPGCGEGAAAGTAAAPSTPGGAATTAAAAGSPVSPSQLPTIVRMGKLHLIDLAGSERVSLSGAEGGTLVEAQNINLSLAALGDVLSTLSHNASSAGARAQQRVAYRNSKLTFFLKDSLGGNSKTIMITNLRCRAAFYQQSLVTLLYASRAKKIKNRSTVNMDTMGDRSKITKMEREVELLRDRLVKRTVAFENLQRERRSGASENEELKARIAVLASANGREKMELEAYMTKVRLVPGQAFLPFSFCFLFFAPDLLFFFFFFPTKLMTCRSCTTRRRSWWHSSARHLSCSRSWRVPARRSRSCRRASRSWCRSRSG